MNIGILFIAAGLKVRMKVNGKALLYREEIKKTGRLMEEIFVWINNSDRKITPIVITPFDEVYELAVQKHIKAVKNDFATASEGSMIKFGINNFPEFDAYLIVSTADLKVFKAEIFESVCMHFEKNPGKIVFSKYENKLRLPIVFSGVNVNLVNSVISNENGKFVFRTNSKNSTFLEISEEIIDKNIYPRDYTENSGANYSGIEKAYSSMQSPIKIDFPSLCETKNKRVVVIRGGGRIASAVAVNLHKFGYSVLITEKEIPETLFRENSFSKAVFVTKKKLNKVEAYLVALTSSNLKNAWEKRVIPVVIDPQLNCLDIISGKSDGSDMFNNSKVEGGHFDPLAAYRESADLGKDEINFKPGSIGGYKLEAICDFTPLSETRVNKASAPFTFGVFENHNFPGGPEILVVTTPGIEFSALRKNNPFNVSRIEEENTDEESEPVLHKLNVGATDNDKKSVSDDKFLKKIIAPVDGKYKEIRRIGDVIIEGDIIAQIEVNGNEKLDISSEQNGIIAGLAISGNFYKSGSPLILIAPADTPKEITERIYPGDNAVGFAILNKLLNRI